jgi:hypothetical protein
MADPDKRRTLAQWKTHAKTVLENMSTAVAQRHGGDLEKLKGMKRSDSAFLNKAILVWDPIQLTLNDVYGGKLTCTYDISETLAGLSKEFSKQEHFTDSDVEEFARAQEIQIDEAMSRVAFRYVEAEIFSRLKAGKYLHEQLQAALKQMLVELVDEAFLKGIAEYGVEVVQPSKTLERLWREQLAHRKKRSGLVPRPGHPPEWSRDEVLAKVKAALLRQRQPPNLARLASAMNYGGLRGGASALGKLLKRHSIEWKKLKRDWKAQQKRT